MKCKGKCVAVPVHVHRVNRLWAIGAASATVMPRDRGGDRRALLVQRTAREEVKLSMKNFYRAAIWSLLLLFAAFFLVPPYVMLVTSLKSISEIRSSSGLLALPDAPNFAASAKAWS